jgi:small subunit ribosomal protein S8
MHTDPIADMLTRVRNASAARHRKVDIPSSRMKRDIARVLLSHRFIRRAVEVPDNKQNVLRVFPRYDRDENPIINGLERISKPSLRRYASVDDLKRINRRLGITVLSTSRGILTGRQAEHQKVGGELLFRVW